MDADLTEDKNHLQNGNACHSEKEQENSKKNSLPIKVHTNRNSPLTDLMEVNHLQTVYNIHVAFCALLLVTMVAYYFAAPQVFWHDLQRMAWASSRPLICLFAWLCLNIYALFVYKGFHFWILSRLSINSKFVDIFFVSLYVATAVLMFAFISYTVRASSMGLITAFALLCEQVRLFMKLYSFIRENVPRVLRYTPADGEQKLIPSLSYFIFFLFVPTLIYRDSYPRTPEIRWKIVFHHLFEQLSCIFIAYCLVMRFNVGVFSDVGLKPLVLSTAILAFAGSMVVGSLLMFLMFYNFLHCWLNACAEMLRFGDRQFYQDWWNSTSFSQYYRKWNGIVYDWLHAYIYVDASRFIGRSKAMVLVFATSALVHEYIITFTLGFFFPVLFLLYFTIGVQAVFLTRKRTAQFWNKLMWAMLFSGWGILIFLYTLEWYARTNCPRTMDTLMDLFLPRFFTSTCHIFAKT